jgi:Zn-finger nucleic acid-binding protein
MKCPNCDEVLVMSERQGVEIDYCPRCRGVWLDKGELDKIIEKSAALENTSRPASDPFYEHRDKPEYRDKPDYYGKNDPYYNRRKKKGFLGDLFDFD